MLENSLSRIKTWLSHHAPRILQYSLNGPATDDEIGKLPLITQKEIPADLIELYKAHNGMNDEENWGNFFHGMLFLSINDILSDQEFRAAQSADIEPIKLTHCDEEIDGSNFYNPDWIAIGHDGSRSYLRVDLSPSAKGTYGQVIFIDGEYNVGLLIARSVSDLLTIFANDLEKGLYTLQEDALEDGQHFLEPAEEIEIINWHKIDKWKKYAQ